MDDSPDIFGDPFEEEDESAPSAAELEAAGQSALFGEPEPAAPPVAERPVAEPAPSPPASSQAAPAAPPAEPYRVLARKYRPQTFSELIGQDAMVQTLANAIRRDRLAHAFLMTGVRGVGKTSTARLIAKALNCVGPDGQGGPTIDPCGRCEPCVAIAGGRHIDVIEMDAASHTGVDDVREIIEAVRYAAVSARYKIYIIDEVHMLSRNAFNALLKTLEEPPAHVKFLFATTEVGKLPVTVLSRCQRFDLKRIAAPLLAEHFARVCESEGIAADPEALAMIAAAAEGSVRDGLSILDQAIAHADLETGGTVSAGQVREMLGLSDKGAQRDLLATMLAGDGKAMLAAIDRQFALGVEPLALVRSLMELVHAVTLTQVGRSAISAASAEERAALENWAGSLGAGQLHRLWQLLLKGHEEVRSAPDPLIALQMALLRAMHAAYMPDPGMLARRLEELAERAPAALAAAPASAAAQSDMAPPWEALVDQVAASAGDHQANIMRLQVRVVELRAGNLVFAQPPEFREDISAGLRKALEQATGDRWSVERVALGGQPTLIERQLAEAEAAEQALRADPLVAAALAAFPGAEFVDPPVDARRASGGFD
ncbi:MAG: DNA polymerase III subunit gamma/tau [Alphaproteobacteria bacterium]|nr:DNA polymerase III subunit gamma/tau [Alphaproteobacteria bacterium]